MGYDNHDAVDIYAQNTLQRALESPAGREIFGGPSSHFQSGSRLPSLSLQGDDGWLCSGPEKASKGLPGWPLPQGTWPMPFSRTLLMGKFYGWAPLTHCRTALFVPLHGNARRFKERRVPCTKPVSAEPGMSWLAQLVMMKGLTVVKTGTAWRVRGSVGTRLCQNSVENAWR